MFDLRAGIKTVIEAADFGERTVTVFDYESTERALESLEKAVFTDAAVFIGDWVETPNVFAFGWTRVENGVELIVAGKSADGKAALNAIITVIAQAVNRTKYAQAYCLTSQLTDVSEMQKNPNEAIWYQYATVDVVALEQASTTQNPIFVTRPTVEVVAENVQLLEGAAVDFKITNTSVAGDAALSKLYVMVGDYEAVGGEGISALQAVITNPTAEQEVIFSLSYTDFPNIAIGSSADYKITVIIVDSIGACGVGTATVTITQPESI